MAGWILLKKIHIRLSWKVYRIPENASSVCASRTTAQERHRNNKNAVEVAAFLLCGPWLSSTVLRSRNGLAYFCSTGCWVATG